MCRSFCFFIVPAYLTIALVKLSCPGVFHFFYSAFHSFCYRYYFPGVVSLPVFLTFFLLACCMFSRVTYLTYIFRGQEIFKIIFPSIHKCFHLFYGSIKQINEFSVGVSSISRAFPFDYTGAGHPPVILLLLAHIAYYNMHCPGLAIVDARR